MSSNLKKLCASLKIQAVSEYLGIKREEDGDQKGNERLVFQTRAWEYKAWKVTIRMGKRRLTTSYRMGMAHTGEPDVASVVYSLISDYQCARDSSFEDFCFEYGYNLDSRKAEKTFKQCRATGPKLEKLLGDTLPQLIEASQDY